MRKNKWNNLELIKGDEYKQQTKMAVKRD